MGERVIHVMTHDSIGLGEDGPTHQPVEHLAALRAIPNLLVFRPCDTVETIECWQLALESKNAPSVLALTRQNLPQLRKEFTHPQLCAAGAYEIARRRRAGAAFRSSRLAPRSPSRSRRRSCSTRGACSRASSRCRASSCSSLPDAATRRAVIGDALVNVAIEAGVRQGWDAIIGADGVFRRHDTVSAPAPRTRSCTAISASRPRRWPKRR